MRPLLARPDVALHLVSAILLLALMPATISAQADRRFRHQNANPAFDLGAGPVACFDSAHNNFHTADGDFWPFAELLRGDRFFTRNVDDRFTAESLDGCDVLVIATPVDPANVSDWSFPHPSAFAGDEIAAVFAWVQQGGGLLMVADHSPIPGALADLAAVFGVHFIDGEARNNPQIPLPDIFDRVEMTLHDHTITEGRGAEDRVDSVATWTGAAFRVSRDFDPLLSYGSLAIAWTELTETFPHLPAGDFPVVGVEGWLAAAARDVGLGRLVVLGETSMCTAQSNDVSGTWGMNTDTGFHNARFCLNAARWLSGEPVNPLR